MNLSDYLLCIGLFYRLSPQVKDKLYQGAIKGKFHPKISRSFDKVKEYKEFLAKNEIDYVTLADDHYPYYLSNIYSPPVCLFTKGDQKLLDHKCLAVVGTRKASAYGSKLVEYLIPPIVKEQYTIASGLARGIDRMAHQQAIDSGGRTIAVLGTGIMEYYPKENADLQDEIGHNHLLVSEYPPHLTARKHHFPLRNRIIAGLSLGTLVIEAQDSSGSLITGHIALEEGREVFSVPGSVFSKNSAGTNQLIQGGAQVVLSSQDIIDNFQLGV